jgi:hypothetical protein
VSDDSPRASRLATPSWLDARLVVGVVLVMLAVVVGARVFASADRYTEVYVARSPLVPGEHLSAADLSVGQVRFAGEGASYVAAGRPPVGYVVTMYVGAGELVPLGAVSATPATAAGSRLVTVPVEPGHFPDAVNHGDLVDVYLSAKPEGAAQVPPPTRVLSSVPVDSVDDGSGSLSGSTTVSVVLAVPDDQVDRVVHAVQSGLIDLVGVPTAAAVSAPSPAATATRASRPAASP